MSSRLENKVVVITGGARGIGKAAALRFIQEGASIAVWDMNEDLGTKTVDELAASGGKHLFCKVNVTDYNSVAEATAKTIDTFGTIDVLINNAGITADATLAKMTPEMWQRVIDVNLTGVFNCTKNVSAVMTEKAKGRIINISSVVGLYGNFGQTNYVATKSGVIGMTKVWARELGKKNITVNAVAPGFIATEMIETVPENVITMLKEKTPLKRLGDPLDIANALLFLSGDEAGYITGTVISVDGGLTV